MIPSAADVDRDLRVASPTPTGVTRQAVNLFFKRDGKDPNTRPARTQELYAILVDDALTSIQTINVVVPHPKPLADDGRLDDGNVVHIPYYLSVPTRHNRLLGRCRR